MSEDVDNIRAAIGDLTALRQRLMAKAADLNTQIDRLKIELANKDSNRRVSDHAVVRYLERVFGIDMEKTREDIRQMCGESMPFANCDGLWHAKGMVFITNEEGAVVTVLGHKQAMNYLGRKLVNGARSAVEVTAEDGEPN